MAIQTLEELEYGDDVRKKMRDIATQMKANELQLDRKSVV